MESLYKNEIEIVEESPVSGSENAELQRLRNEYDALDDSHLAEIDESRLIEFGRVLDENEFQNLKVFIFTKLNAYGKLWAF